MKAAKALKEKGETPEELLQSIKKNEAAVAEAQRVVDAWKAIAGERKRRAEEAERVVQEKAEEEARVEAEKKAEAERKAEEEQRAAEEKRIAEEKAEAERKAQEERERAEVEERDRIEAELDAQKTEEEARLEAERKAEEEAVEKDAELKEDKKKPQLKDVVKAIYEKGKSAASRLYKMAFFDVAKTPDFMKKLWLTGDRFTIKYVVLSRHAGKDDSHSLTEKLWEELPDALQKPFAITRFGGKDKGYRLYTTMKNENGETIVVGVDVKNVGRDMEVNAISTIFGRRGDAKKTQKEDVLYTAENITPEQRSLLGQPNSDQYTGVRERNVSADKGSEKPEKKQEKQSVFDKAKEIADKEEKKRKAEAEAEADSVLGQATRAVGKKKKVNLFKYTVSEKNSIPVLRGVHYANGYAYASDGYILFKEKADYPKEWEGTTRDKDGNLIDGKYPDTEKAIHRLVHIPDKEVESLPSKEVLDFAIAASKKLKGEAIPVAIDGLFFNAVNLKKFLEAVASKGMDKVVYRHPMLYATNGKDEIVLMPTVNTLEGALDIADRMESAGLPKEQIDAWKEHIEAADKKKSFDDFKKAVENAKKEGVRPTEADKQESKAEAEKQKVDKQGNPIDAEGRLITEKVEDISDLSDDDFNNPTRSVELPKIPKNVDDALGANGRPVIIKKNIFEKNGKSHGFTPEQSRKILGDALYNPDIVGQSQPSTKKTHWVAIKVDEKSPITILEVNDGKDNVEVVGWYTLDARNLERIKRQAEREGGELLVLSPKDKVESLPTPTSGLPTDKGSEVGGEKQEAEKKRPAPIAERIEDVGEKIGDARKDVWKEIIARIKNKKQGIEEALKKSSAGKLFSSLFDEKELLESGVSNEVVTFISAVKGSLGTKPRSLSKLKMWINKVLHQYDMCEQALENWESVKKKIDEWKYYSQPFYMYRAAMAVGGYESGRDVGNAELWQIADGYSDGKSVAGQWCVRKAGAYDGIYKTYEEAAEALKKFAGENAAVDGKGKRKEVKLAIYKRRTDGTMFIAPEGKPDVIIQDGFKTLYEASAYKKEHYAEMQERYRTLMDGIKPKFNENRERKGRDWRGGKDVSAEDFREAFDFRGVEFGNWMQQKDRRQALNECYDSLMDLAMVCGVSPKALSLGGKLAMAFGARGGGKFNAHYEPDKVVINLTKTKGAGSLAHEWFHAIDNYFNMQGWDEFATESTRNVERKEMAEAWKDLVRAINGSDYFKRSDKYARLKGSRYWIEPTELGARAFAVWVENRLSKYGTINDYLANNPRLVDEKASDAEKKYAPYPFDKDADWMDEKFGRLFEVMQERVDEETGKHILYSRNKAAGHEKTELTAEERELRDNLVERMRKGGLDVVTDSEEMQRVIDTENERTRMMGAGSVREHRVYHGSGADFDAFDHSHMGEGEGAQAYGWGTYVTEVEGIGKTYAEQNVTKHNDALRALQHDVDAISDQLNRHRDDLKYDEEQLKRANEWRAEAELDKETALSTAEFIAKTRPKVVTIENVKGYRNSEALKIITDELTRQGYDWDADVYNAADYGGYTKRERLIVRAKRDGKLPPKPEKLPEELRKKGWYSAVEDLIPHLEEKKTGVPQGTDERLKNSGIDYRTIDKPLYVFGRGYANKTVGHAFADELLPTLTTGGGDIIIMPDGRVLKASPRVLARVTGLPDTYKMPETDQLSHTIVGNGIPTQLTEGVIAPLLDNAIPSAERATKRESVFDVADRVSQNLEARTRAMGSRVEKRMADVAQKLEGKELSMEQKAVVDVFSGEKDNQKFSVERNGVKQQFLLKQGQEDKAGAKHSLYRHYGTNTGVITAADVLKIPQVLERGERIEKAKGGKKMAVYTMDIDGVKYTVLTRVGKNNEIVDDFYSNKKGSESSVYRNVENIDNTPEGARRKDSEPSAKVEDKSESPKLFGEEIIDDGKKGSDSIDRSVRENPKNEDKPRFSRKPGESIFDYASRVSEDVDRSVREIVSARDEYEKKVKSKGFQTKEALQNSMLGLQEFMLAIDHASGNKRYIEDIPDFENPILGENRLSSVNKEESHSRLDAVHSPTPTKGVRKPYLRSYTMIYMPLADIFFPRMYQAPDGFMAVRITLMYYVDFYSLFNNPEKEWDIILSKAFDAPSEPSLFD